MFSHFAEMVGLLLGSQHSMLKLIWEAFLCASSLPAGACLGLVLRDSNEISSSSGAVPLQLACP